ncbi:hypothetical protein NQ318_018289 [Aromia moschata]|uniref:Non-structural maintenance of chromosomes element 4 n=1 Tax=Aromia moschata TaxID=1265417 RepID=A0AAV8ZGF1_9CUCU|nr:hypothetical protein NQ318_018289 [Aromia moschata]
MDCFSDENQENNLSPMKRTPQERKLSYRNLLNKVEGIERTDDVGLQAINQLGEVLREANSLDTEWKIDERVEHAGRNFVGLFSPIISEYFIKKVQYIQNEESEELLPTDLLKLLEDARNILPEVPESGFVYGAYDLDKVPEPKTRKPRQKVAKETLQRKEPERVTNLDKEEESIEEIVKVFNDVLNEKYMENNEEPINYYDYIIDTDSFANTVENMFYFAFLIRDGKAQIDLNKEGKPIIMPIKASTLKQFRDEGGVNTQVITQVSMEQWEMFGELRNIDDRVIYNSIKRKMQGDRN